MKNLVIKYFITPAFLINISFSQDFRIENEAPYNKESSEKSIIKKEPASLEESSIILYKYSLSSLNLQKNTAVENPFDVVSSFKSNIRFGGFWDKYAIVNFTPQMFIKPFDFISLYASHNMSYFVPIKGIRQHFKTLAIQGAAVVAVENALRFLLPSGSLLKSLLSFAIKNIVITSMMKSVTDINKTSDPVIEYGYYYYSLSIRF